MPKKYREGAIGALMDEYERAAEDLKSVLSKISRHDYVAIVDKETNDPDCRSIQTIMNHVVRASYGYAILMRRQYNEPAIERKATYTVDTPALACSELDAALAYTEATLQNKWNMSFDEVLKNKIETQWGQTFDFEQLLEHAIVHILRHRRQIEKFLIRLEAGTRQL